MNFSLFGFILLPILATTVASTSTASELYNGFIEDLSEIGEHIVSLIQEEPQYGEFLKGLSRCAFEIDLSLEEKIEKCKEEAKEFSAFFDDYDNAIESAVSRIDRLQSTFVRTHLPEDQNTCFRLLHLSFLGFLETDVDHFVPEEFRKEIARNMSELSPTYRTKKLAKYLKILSLKTRKQLSEATASERELFRLTILYGSDLYTPLADRIQKALQHSQKLELPNKQIFITNTLSWLEDEEDIFAQTVFYYRNMKQSDQLFKRAVGHFAEEMNLKDDTEVESIIRKLTNLYRHYL